MTRISKNFTLEEMIASRKAKLYGIKNKPNTEQVCALCALVHNVLQPLRNYFKKPIKISSGFRNFELNKRVGGVGCSQHLEGEAADIDIEGDMSFGKAIFHYIKGFLEFDQLIWEHDQSGVYWVHVSYRADGRNRKQVLELLKK